MLEKLFGSRARVKILKFFLLNPDKKLYIRQLSRRLKLQLNSCRRELDNLEKFGILTSQFCVNDGDSEDFDKQKKIIKSKQEKKYYQVNKEFILFEEIKLLIVRAQILYKRDFINKLLAIGKPHLLLLSGIFTNKLNSPTDLLIVGQFNKNKLAVIIKELESELGKEINYTVMSSKEFKYRRDITDTFLYDILEGEKIVVIDKIGF